MEELAMKYQKAETSWELYCLEHSARWWVAIRPKCWEVWRLCMQHLLQWNHPGKYVPRAVFVELEPSVVGKW